MVLWFYLVHAILLSIQCKTTVVNTWMFIVYKYGCVCTSWRAVIFSSRLLFDKKIDDFEPFWEIDEKKKRVMGTFPRMNNDQAVHSKLRSLIKDGYMQLVNEMHLTLSKNEYMEILRLARDYAAESSVQYYFAHARGPLSADAFLCFIELLDKSANVTRVDIWMNLYNQEDAMIAWTTLIAIIKIQKIKNVGFRINCRYTYEDINMNFLKEYSIDATYISHIEKIDVYTDDRYLKYDQTDECTLSDFSNKFLGKKKLRLKS